MVVLLCVKLENNGYTRKWACGTCQSHVLCSQRRESCLVCQVTSYVETIKVPMVSAWVRKNPMARMNAEMETFVVSYVSKL